MWTLDHNFWACRFGNRKMRYNEEHGLTSR